MFNPLPANTALGAAPARVAGSYAAFALLWIWLSDRTLVWLGYADDHAFFAAVWKGSLFVAVTALLLLWLVRRELTARVRSESLLRAVVEGTTDAVFVKDRAGRYLLANAAAAGFMGRTVAEVIGRDDRELFAAADAERLIAGDRAIMAGGEPVTAEETLTATGVTRTYHATKAPYRDEAGQVVGLVGISRDVTAARRAEAAVREGEGRFRAMADAAPVLMWLADAAGGCVWFNRRWLEFTGRPLDREVGDGWAGGVHPDDRAGCLRAYRAAFDARQPFEIDYRLRRHDGEFRWVLDVGVPREAGGEFAGYIGSCVDITDRKRAEEAVRASEARLRELADAIPQIVWTAGPDGLITHVNAKGTEYTGLQADELASSAWERVIHPDDVAHAKAEWARTIGDGVPRPVEMRIRRADGAYRWHICRQRPVRDAGGRIGSWVGTNTDVDDLKQTEAALRDTDARLRDAQRIARLGSWGWEPPADRVWWSDAEFELFGVDPQVVTPSFAAFLAVVHPDDRAVAVARVEAMKAGADQFADDLQIVRPNGEVLWIHSRARATRDAAGVLVRVEGTDQDITVQRRAQEAVRESEARLQAAVEVAALGVIVVDYDRQTATLSPRAAEQFGFATGTPVTRSDLHARFHPDDRAELERLTAVALDPGGSGWFSLEHRIVRPDGTTRWLHVRKQVSFTDGRPRRAVVVTSDVTERRLAEARLREQEMRVREAAELAQVGGWGFDPVTLESDWTPEVARIYGLDPAAPPAVGSVLEYFSRDQRPTLEAALTAAIQVGTPHDLELQMTAADGQEKWVRTICRPIVEGGKVTRVRGSLQDITERKRAEEALRASEARYRLLFESNPHPMWVYDVDSLRFLAVNAAAVEWYGYTRDEFLAMTIRDIRPVEELPRLEAAVARTSHGLARSSPRRHRRKDGTVFDVEVSSHDLAGGDGRLRLVLALDISERLRAEAALRTSEERLQEATRVAGVGVFEHDHGTGADFWSARLRDIMGYDPDAPADLSAYLAMVHPADLDAIAAAVGRAHDPAGDGRFDVLHRLIRPADGRVVWLAMQSQTQFDGEGPDRRPTRTVGATVDVTDRRLADEALRASEERYRRLVEVLPEAVFVNTDGRVAFCNPACQQLFGAADTDALVGRSPFDLFAPEYRDAIGARIRVMQESGQPVPGLDERIVRLDGRTVPVHVVATPVTDGGRPAILVCLRDLTAQERSAALLRTVLGSVADAILTIDTRGTVKSANPAAVRASGYAEDELVGRNVRQLMAEPDHSAHDEYLAAYLRTGVAKVIGIGREVECRRRDGTRFPAELTVTEFALDGERHFTGVLRDITARKRLEEQFRQSQKMEAVGRLAGGVAHDFNNLLTVINGYCELLLASDLPARGGRESVAAIRDAGERAARLTQQLLAFSRKTVLSPKVLDLSELVSESARLLRRLIGEDVVLAVVTAPTPVRVKADPGQLEQVIMNLVVNARDAMPTGGRLTLETATVAASDGDPTRFARLSVTDTGHGMTDEVKEKIFEPFFTTKGVGKGTGLGLAVVHGVVAQSGGRIVVESAVGVGTTFRVLLPLVPAEAGVSTEEAAPVVRRGSETVLLVEDEDAVRTIARLSLEMQGYAVLEADGGAAAVRLAAEHPGVIHLVVSDVVMPEMGGRQLLDAVRRHLPGVRALFMSGYTDDAVLLHGVEEATDAFIQKPFTPLSLARKVREVLDAPPG